MMAGRHTILLSALFMTLLLAGCGRSDADGDYIARVGDHYLTQEDVSEQLGRLPFAGDSLEAREQIIEQWVTNELLYRESRRRGLRSERDVQRQLEENERSVMVSALISRMYAEEEPEVDEAELAAMYERDKERLRLREPFVQVRYLAVRDREAAAEVRTALQRPPSDVDEEAHWRTLVDAHASDPAMSLGLSTTYTAEARLFTSIPALREALGRLRDGQVTEVHEADSLFHVVQLVHRAPVGTIPQISWIEEELARRLLIQSRKQLYARQVQRLRNEALAREDLEVR